MKIGKYELINNEKVERALGEIIKPDGTHDEDVLLAEYDKLGGLIRNQEGSKVKTGSFYDFKNKKPFEKREVFVIFNINGEFVEVPEGKEKPEVVKAAETLEKQKIDKVDKKKKDKKTK